MYLSFIYAVMLSQIAVLYWLAAPATIRLLYQSYLNKNPQWVAANPGFVDHAAQQRRAIALSRLLGALWLANLAYGVSGARSEQWLSLSLLLPMFVWLALELAVAGIAYRRVCQLIPLPAKRRATLERRTLAEFVHMGWILPGYVLLLAIGAGYLAAYLTERIDLTLMGWRLASLVAGTLIWTGALHYCIRRKKQPVDDALGPAYRRSEVLGTIPCLYLFALVLAVRALQDLFGVALVADVSLFAGASIVLQAAVLIGLTHPALNSGAAHPL